MIDNNTFKKGNIVFLKNTFTVILVGVFLFTNTLGWAQEEKLFSSATENKALSSGSAHDNKLAPSLRTKSDEFRKKFLATELFLPHSLLNDYIKSQIEEIGYENLQKEIVRIEGIESEIELIAIPELLRKTGQFGHVGLGRHYKRPVIYIDSALYKNKDIRQHEFDEIIKWEMLRNKLGLKPEEMRDWIKTYIDVSATIERLQGTDYYNETTIKIAEIIHKNCHPIPHSLYEEYGDRIDYEYIMDLLSRYGDDVIKEKDVNISAHDKDAAKRKAAKDTALLLETAAFSGASQPTRDVARNPDIKEKFNSLSKNTYPQQLLTQMKQDGYNPIVVGYDHDDLSNIANEKAVFEAVQRANPGQIIKVAYEIIPAIQLQYLKDFVKDEREYNKSGTIGGKTPSRSTVSNLQAYREKIRYNRSHAEILALWLLDNGFDLIPINSQDVQGWILEDERKIATEGGVSPSGWSHLLRPALTAIRSDIYGIKVIERERPDIISVGSAHALKLDLLLERDGSRSFYFFLDIFRWDRLLNLWEEAHSLYRPNQNKQKQKEPPKKPTDSSDINRSPGPSNRDWATGGGFYGDDYDWLGSPASCLGSIIEYCNDNLEKDFSAQDLFDSSLRKKKDKKTNLSLDTVKLELRQLHQAGVLDLKDAARPYRYILRSDIRNFPPLDRDKLISAIRTIPELNNYRTLPRIIKSIVRSHVERMIGEIKETGTIASWQKGVNLQAYWQNLVKKLKGNIPPEGLVNNIDCEFPEFVGQSWDFPQQIMDSNKFRERILDHYGVDGKKKYAQIIDNLKRLRAKVLSNEAIESLGEGVPSDIRNRWNYVLRDYIGHPYFSGITNNHIAIFENVIDNRISDNVAKQSEAVDYKKKFRDSKDGTKDLQSVPWSIVADYQFVKILEATGYWVNHVDPYVETKEMECIKGVKMFTADVNMSNFDVHQRQGNDGIRSSLEDMLDLLLTGNMHSDPTNKVEGKRNDTYMVNDKIKVAEYMLRLQDATSRGQGTEIHILHDNVGLELISIFWFIDFCIRNGVATKFVLHTKNYPYCVSDVCGKTDFDMQLEVMRKHGGEITALANRISDYINKTHNIEIAEPNYFLTLGQNLSNMPEDMYSKLKGADLIMIMGDFLYRKAFLYRRWEHTANSKHILSYFPAPTLMVRMVKSPVLAGMLDETDRMLDLNSNDVWWKSRKFGVLDFVPNVDVEKRGRTSGTGSKIQAELKASISENLPIRAKIFADNLTKILAKHPEQLFFMGVETDIGESQKAQIMPIYKAIDEIRDMKDASGKPLFPNLMVRRARARELATMVSDLNKEGKLNLNNAFIGARKASVDNKTYDAIRGEDRAWISAIDDSNPSDYLPVFEAITLNMMAYLNANVVAIKNFYDAISDKPIDPSALQDMIRNRTIYILPKATAFDTKQLRELYELAHQVYIAA